MNAIKTIDRHKTKALGVATVALGFLQTDPRLEVLLPETVYAWLMVLVGLGVVVCGFINSWHEHQEASGEGSQGPGGPPGQVGYARVDLLALILALTFTLGACSWLGSPAPEGFNERLAAGYSSLRVVREGAGVILDGRIRAAESEPDPARREALLQAAKADAQNVQDQADKAREGLDVALMLRDVDITSAERRLEASITIISALLTYMETKR